MGAAADKGALIASGKIFENMLQLKRFGLYFEIILNRKWLYFHIEIVISDTEMLGGSGTYMLPAKFLKCLMQSGWF